ncbi:MAG TPA: hypothetical protein VFV41_01550 [Streptosporangiaceae bacterium]|nr:hypothetical protein [Streptosporangiaceae bacterium]
MVRACLRRAHCPVVVVSADGQPAGRTRARQAGLASDDDRVAR